MTRKEKQESEIERLQQELQREINSSVIKPFSFEIYKKTPEEKVLLSIAKSQYKQSIKNRIL
jgi:hypothetical protein